MKYIFFISLLIAVIFTSSCKKEPNAFSCLTETRSKKILIDASKDGGVWWFPQKPGKNDLNLYHQGQKLANYLRSLGYEVDELTQGTMLSHSLLQAYSKVIRAGAIDRYTTAELDAYDAFLSRESSLLLIQDHLSYFPNDMLCERLNITFAGAGGKAITQFNSHPVTKGVASIPFITGSAVVNTNKSHMTILGSLAATDFVDMNHNRILDSGDLVAPPVMGILHHPTSRIFFTGDVNGLEQVPQPFAENLIKWLFGW